MTPLSRYRQDLERPDFNHDPAQEHAIGHLQRVYEALIATPRAPLAARGFLQRLSRSVFAPNAEPVRGLYFWGGVGRGKTYLVDAFYDCLPFEDKLRLHFHRFMEQVHETLKTYKDQQNPLVLVGRQFAENARVICLDEFFVSDITDAMLLAGLLNALFANGVTLVSTSNIPPERLYWSGLQRARFLPAIALLEQYTQVVNLDGGTDYRLRYLEKAEVYHHPLDRRAEEIMEESFQRLAPEPGHRGGHIEVEGRLIATRREADGVVWFDFPAICDGPRNTSDYIEIARCYHTALISGVPVFDWQMENQARRFLNLVDEFYDRGVKLILSASAPLETLYQGEKLVFEYERARSRLHEMQSTQYLAKPHLP
ncbi:MAG: AFG1 family ATPase [Chromatiales bacterium]|nr:AFG1 family ATPase [Chromatiales bacterium]